MNKAVFLDRDGNIIHDPGYLSDLKKFRFYKNSVKGLKLLQDSGFKLVVLTNQSGVARGFYGEDFVKATHKYMSGLLEKHGVKIDAYYYCPHHVDASVEKYKKDCECRKPKTGMIDMAVKKFKIDLKKSWSIGDKLTDVKLGKNAGTKTALVLTGKGKKQERKIDAKTKPDIVSANLYSAAKKITAGLKKEKK